MTTQHTPGPWSVEIDHHNNAPEYIRAYADGEMYDLASVLCDETGNATANAQLIAAAPDLLKALRALASTARTFRNVPKEEQEWTSIDDDALKAAFAAIAKATGGAA